jgi:lipopolysaccharide biosynthesis glycosyltransferase
MVVDLQAWRDADLPAALLACLAQNEQHVLWWDQYALNVVLSGRWGALDVKWNQGANVFAYPDWQHSPYDRQTYERLRDDPYIVHFTTRHKPWHLSCRHPLCDAFFDYVDRTSWAGWRPSWLNDPKAFSDFLKTQERRIRRARQRVQSHVGRWWKERRERVSA